MWKRLVPFFLVLALVAAACGGDDADDTTTTEAAAEEAADSTSVVDIAIENGGFTTLVAAIEAAGLVETLEGDGPFTVLAPTNAAFDSAFEALGITAEELLADTDTLTKILTYHVLPLEANSQLVSTLDGESVPTVNGQSVAIAVSDGVITINSAEVVSPDLAADNGIVHVVNAVLLPPDVAEALGVAMEEPIEETTTTTAAPTTTEAPAELGTIVDVAVESGQFPTLVAALQATGLDEVLSGEGPFTVFAPTEEAFAAALEALEITAEELLADTETLTSILTYHVVATNAPAEVVVTLDGQDIETVNGATLLVTIDGDNVMVNEANVVAVDIFGSNGVIHVIDGVLLPPAE